MLVFVFGERERERERERETDRQRLRERQTDRQRQREKGRDSEHLKFIWRMCSRPFRINGTLQKYEYGVKRKCNQLI